MSNTCFWLGKGVYARARQLREITDKSIFWAEILETGSDNQISIEILNRQNYKKVHSARLPSPGLAVLVFSIKSYIYNEGMSVRKSAKSKYIVKHW